MKVTINKSGRSKKMGLETLVELFQNDSQRKPVLQVREVLRHCAPYHPPVGMEKIPTVHFSSLYCKEEWHQYTGLVLIEYQKLDSYAEARGLCSQIVCYTRLQKEMARRPVKKPADISFECSHEGAHRASLIHSLACSCRLHGINIFEYFTDLLHRFVLITPNTDKQTLRNLLPDKWKKQARSQCGDVYMQLVV